MAMPGNQMNYGQPSSAFEPPDDRSRVSRLVDYELGGIAIGDTTQGLQSTVWEARLSGDIIQCKPEADSTWTDITSDTGITELSLAFDQVMRPTVAYMAGSSAKIYWYDGTVPGYVTTTLAAGASSPVVTLDDKRRMESNLSDILLFYLLGGRVMHRRQRDRFATQYDLAAVPTGATRIKAWGMTVGKRVQLAFE